MHGYARSRITYCDPLYSGTPLQPLSRSTMLSSINRFLKAYNYALQGLGFETRVDDSVCAYVTQCVTAIKPAVRSSRGIKNNIG